MLAGISLTERVTLQVVVSRTDKEKGDARSAALLADWWKSSAQR
jgi:hypothetical protein